MAQQPQEEVGEPNQAAGGAEDADQQPANNLNDIQGGNAGDGLDEAGEVGGSDEAGNGSNVDAAEEEGHSSSGLVTNSGSSSGESMPALIPPLPLGSGTLYLIPASHLLDEEQAAEHRCSTPCYSAATGLTPEALPGQNLVVPGHGGGAASDHESSNDGDHHSEATTAVVGEQSELSDPESGQGQLMSLLPAVMGGSNLFEGAVEGTVASSAERDARECEDISSSAEGSSYPISSLSPLTSSGSSRSTQNSQTPCASTSKESRKRMASAATYTKTKRMKHGADGEDVLDTSTTTTSEATSSQDDKRHDNTSGTDTHDDGTHDDNNDGANVQGSGGGSYQADSAWGGAHGDGRCSDDTGDKSKSSGGGGGGAGQSCFGTLRFISDVGGNHDADNRRSNILSCASSSIQEADSLLNDHSGNIMIKPNDNVLIVSSRDLSAKVSTRKTSLRSRRVVGESIATTSNSSKQIHPINSCIVDNNQKVLKKSCDFIETRECRKVKPDSSKFLHISSAHLKSTRFSKMNEKRLNCNVPKTKSWQRSANGEASTIKSCEQHGWFSPTRKPIVTLVSKWDSNSNAAGSSRVSTVSTTVVDYVDGRMVSQRHKIVQLEEVPVTSDMSS